MPVGNFIPEIWSARLLDNLHNAHVYGDAETVNTDYEGEINEAGDTVRINAIGTIAITDYVKNTDHAAPEELDSAQTTLQITQSKMFNFQVDDVDKAQSKPKFMDAAMAEAAYQLSDVADMFIAGKYVEAATANLIGDTGSPKTDLGTAGNPYNYLVDMGVKLDEAKIPKVGRWVIVPSWFHGLLLKDEKFVSFGTQGNAETLRQGDVGMAAGFKIKVSNNVPNTAGTKYRIMAGYKGAITYASQIRKVEAYRPQLRFADAVKGLMLYGAKVVRPSGLVVLTANRPS